VYAGDTLYSESKVTGKRESKSRSNAGIITVQTRGFNQAGDVCITFERTFLVMKRGVQDLDIYPSPTDAWPSTSDVTSVE
jgi:itaconyl-CoA hydratase